MAHTATESQFPELSNDGRLRVYKNPSNEIFVEDIRSGATIRIGAYPHLDGGLQFTTDGRVDPVQVHGMIGWCVTRR